MVLKVRFGLNYVHMKKPLDYQGLHTKIEVGMLPSMSVYTSTREVLEVQLMESYEDLYKEMPVCPVK